MSFVIVREKAINRSAFLFALLPSLFVLNWSNCKVSFMAALQSAAESIRDQSSFAFPQICMEANSSTQRCHAKHTSRTCAHTSPDYSDPVSVGCNFMQGIMWWAVLFITVQCCRSETMGIITPLVDRQTLIPSAGFNADIILIYRSFATIRWFIDKTVNIKCKHDLEVVVVTLIHSIPYTCP